MANTAGGYVVVGVTNNFEAVGASDDVLASLDEATLRQQLRSYAAVPIDVFVNRAPELEEKKFGVITVLPTRHPLIVFEANDEYGTRSAHKIVFRRGEVFVRHGSSSSVWTQADVAYLYLSCYRFSGQHWPGERFVLAGPAA
ncbi:MAG: helix-turn-helix domain-containing protein [Ginsengibacter sp.]